MSGLMTTDLYEMEDHELVDLARDGDQGAFSELVRRHHERIFQMVYALVGNREDADDLAQEVFLKAYRSLHRFQGQSKFYTWVYRIGVNCCLDWMKVQKRRKNVSRMKEWWDRCEESEALFTQPERPDVKVARREFHETLEAALALLVPDYRTALVMRELNGLSYEEIATSLGCSVGTVKSRLFRARSQLKETLMPVYQEWMVA
ncbi:MAG: sigma-70 family RNA polymerase sigma factor [bacterium]|nr:sigma-70 family RNA polymerase sigma factor [bacterium]